MTEITDKYRLDFLEENEISISNIKENKIFFGYIDGDLGRIKKESSTLRGLIDELIYWKTSGAPFSCKYYSVSDGLGDISYKSECNRYLDSPLLQSHDENIKFDEFYSYCPYCGKRIFKIG